MTTTWILRKGDRILGRLSACNVDQPWTYCQFEETSEFSEVRELFQRELELLNEDKMDQWEDVYGQIDALGLSLESEDGKAIKDFILHVDGTESWFRA